MTTQRRRAALGAIGATLLLFAATACGSETDDAATDAATETTPEAAIETTVGGTEAPSTPDATVPNSTTAERSDGSSGGTVTPSPPTTALPVLVPELLQFTAPLVGGGTFDGAAAAGKPTVFWFWAPT